MLFFIIAFLIVLADQVVKYFITVEPALRGIDIIPEILRITYDTNTGCAFSMLSDYTFYLAIASCVAILILIILLIFGKFNGFGKLALAFLMGGAIGNVIDRFAIGYVVDMFQPLFINFAVFNVADIFITLGAIMLIIFLLFMWHPGKKKAAESELVEEGPAPYNPFDHKPRNAKERREARHLKRFGPDIDESTISVPVKDVQDALSAMENGEAPELPEIPEEPAVDASETKVIPNVSGVSVEAVKTEAPKAAPASEEKHEFTLEEIMKEYGSGF